MKNSNGVNSGQKYELIRCKVIIVVAKGYAGSNLHWYLMSIHWYFGSDWIHFLSYFSYSLMTLYHDIEL